MVWLNLAVIPHFSWPNAPISLPFEGKTICLFPEADNLACQLSLLEPAGIDYAIAATTLSRFLSRFSWSNSGGARELYFSGSNNPAAPDRLCAGPYGKSGWAMAEPPHYIYLPSAKDQNADLALALYREAMSVNSEPYAFLSYFKVLNIRFAKGDEQCNWINDNLHHIWHQAALDRLKILRVTQTNIGRYMYQQGRCAVAHTNCPPVVNPDIYIDKRRLQDDLPLMKQLASLFIESEFGVFSDQTFQKCFQDKSSEELLMKGAVVDGFTRYTPYRASELPIQA